MEYLVKEYFVTSSDKTRRLAGKVYIPSGEIKALFHIVHGMTEHIDRYDGIMSALAKKGVLTFGYDNLGHGKTANDDGELGYIAEENGFEHLVEDVKIFADEIKKEYPEKDYFLFGHSMGSFIVRLAALKYPKGIKKLIVCGTAGPNPLSSIGISIAKILKKKKGDRAYSPFLENMAFGAYNKRFTEDEKYAWLTKDMEIIEKYKKDKFCTFHFTVSALLDLITLTHNCNKESWFKGIDSKLPIFLISGDMDPVGNYGSGVLAVYNKLRTYNKKVSYKLYENCRHEILNDSSKEEVIKDIIEFCGF